MITSLLYIIINLIIGGVITESTSVFLLNSILYLMMNFIIFFYFYSASLKTEESLKSIFEKGKVRIFLSKIVFLVSLLFTIKVNSTFSWILPWLTTFAAQIGGLNLFLFFYRIEEIMADYVHQEMTRNLILVYLSQIGCLIRAWIRFVFNGRGSAATDSPAKVMK